MKSFPCRARISPATIGGRASFRARGKKRLEETAILFLRSSRPLPTELLSHANPARFAEIEQSEKEQRLVQRLEHWLFPSAPTHLDSPRASLRVACEARPVGEDSALHGLTVSFHISRQRTGEKVKTLGEVVDLTARAAHEQELFSFGDWEFIQWLAESHADPEGLWSAMVLTGLELLQWLVQWGDKSRLLLGPAGEPIVFRGDLAELKPRLEDVKGHLFFTHHLALPSGRSHPLERGEVLFRAAFPGAGGKHVLFAAQRAAGRPAQFLGATTGPARSQTQPPPAHATAQNPVGQRPGVGTIVRGAEGRPALHFRIGG